MYQVRVVTDNRHLMQVIGEAEDRRYRILCPDGGANCQCWIECQEDHRCDCGPHPHDKDCPPICDEDHSLECTEWLDREDGELHGVGHRWVSGMICVRDIGCWMPQWDIEFDQVNHVELYRPGVYEFDYEDPDDDMGGCLYVVSLRPAEGAK